MPEKPGSSPETHQSVQSALQRSKERFQSLVENIDGIVWEALLNPLRFTYVSPKAASMYGFDPEAWLGQMQLWHDAVHPDDRDYALAYSSAETAAGRDHTFQFRMITPKRGLVWIQDIVTLVWEDGEPVGLRGIFVDITERVRTEKALMASEARYRTIVQFQQELICRWLPDGTLTFVNDAYCAFFGKPREELLGTSFYELIPEEGRFDLRTAVTASLAKMNPENPTLEYVHQALTAAGQTCWQQWTDHAVFDRDGRLLEMQSVGRDITANKDAEQQLQRQYDFYSTLAEGIGGIIWEIDFPTLAFTYMSPQLHAFLGIPPEEWLGSVEKWLAAIHPDDRQKTFDYCLAEVLAGRDFNCDYRVNTPRRGTVWLRAIGSVATRDGQPTKVRGVTIDVTTQHSRQKALQTSNRQLRKFSLHLERVREDERQQISRQLHDDLGQSLTALNFDVAWLKKRITDPHLLDRLEDMTTQIRQTTQTVQRVCAELRPTLLDDLGLSAAMEWHLNEFTRRTGIPIQKNLCACSGCDSQLAAHYYRIFLEALTNIMRHAEATEVDVSLIKRNRSCHLEIADNGRGISRAATRRASAFGLLGIRERARLLGGTARISPRPGGGTLVRVSAPCSRTTRTTEKE